MTTPCQNLFREAHSASNGTTRRSVTQSVTRSVIRSAHAIGPLGRSAAIATTIIALISALQNGVPAASAISVALLVPAAMVDIVEQRLPNQIIAASALALAIGLALNSSNVLITNVMLGVALLAGPLLVLHLIAPGSMGFGDVKMALVLGAAVGAVHWQLALVTIAFASGASATVALLRRMTEIAFGPVRLERLAELVRFLATSGAPLSVALIGSRTFDPERAAHAQELRLTSFPDWQPWNPGLKPNRSQKGICRGPTRRRRRTEALVGRAMTNDQVIRGRNHIDAIRLTTPLLPLYRNGNALSRGGVELREYVSLKSRVTDTDTCSGRKRAYYGLHDNQVP